MIMTSKYESTTNHEFSEISMSFTHKVVFLISMALYGLAPHMLDGGAILYLGRHTWVPVSFPPGSEKLS